MFFFFSSRRRHTRFKCDWSSDVCSSDLRTNSLPDETISSENTMTYQSVFRPELFKGKTIIVTGGGSGIGRCTAHELAALGSNVAILGRTAEKLAQVKAEIEEDGGEILTQVCDI